MSKTSLNKEKMLTPRQKNLLFAVIKEYCETGQTIGSKELKEKYGFNFSPATIRNEFSRLRDLGYLFQPFTNSSSQPTEKAFKLFINQLITGLQVTNRRQQDLKRQILEMEEKQTNLNKEISRLLASSGGVGFAVDNERENVTGISNLLASNSEGKITDLLDFLDNLDSYKKPLLETKSNTKSTLNLLELSGFKGEGIQNIQTIQTYFGSENPVVPLGHGYAMVATKVKLPKGDSVVGLIAPTYLLARKKNLELVDALSKVLNEKKSKK